MKYKRKSPSRKQYKREHRHGYSSVGKYEKWKTVFNEFVKVKIALEK